MANRTLSVMMRIGLLSDEMTPPRRMAGIARVLFSLVAVAYSYFFIHISFFGPPVQEIFKGTFLLGVIVMSILLYKHRQRPARENFVWLDEFFTLVNLVMVCAMIAVWAHWSYMSTQVEKISEIFLWRRYLTDEVLIVGYIGGAIGAALYVWEGFIAKHREGLVLSDLVFIVAGIASIWWWGDNLIQLTERIGGSVAAQLVFFSIMLAAVSFEIARRIVGPLIPFLGFLFFIYSFDVIAQAMPGVLNHPGFRTARVMEFLMLSTEGMLGLIIEVFATYIVIFVILGSFLQHTGLGALIIDAAYRMTGPRTGGPGIAAVISSGFFGMISGSGVANVVTTGTFTIPLMKRVGYRGEFAGGVEAAASTGGGYMPPIMGAGAFLLAELTETPYSEIIVIALMPALLYYLSVGLMVYFRAVRFKLHGVPASELPRWSDIIPRLHLLLPIPVMVYLLVLVGDSPFLAAAKTIVVIIMLKTIDLLDAIPTPNQDRVWKPFLAISLLVGVLVYFFGMMVGAPFSWFVEDYVGINVIDALFWVLASFIILKLGELLVTGTRPVEEARAAPETLDPAAATTTRVNTVHTGSSARDGLASIANVVVDLVKTIWVSMEAGARNTLVVSCIAGVLGILLAAATQSNLPGRVSDLLVAASFGLLPLTIFWVIVAGYVVGMGLPITASYVILAVFSVGALTEFGVTPLAAHMISYWVAVVSAVTPPVALAAYAASAIANSDPIKTGTQAVKLASMIFITPFLFVYTPLLLTGTTTEVAVTAVASAMGVFAWALFLETRPLLPFGRVLMGFSAACLLMPMGTFFAFVTGAEGDYLWSSYAVGAAILVALILTQRILKGRVVAIG